ncbi:MAG: hypothetical protein E6I82_06810 [Chloroflexi bacterium]|nr:MAG: hypothetical protein E6I82_06810 [Chloroflexota bacterium]
MIQRTRPIQWSKHTLNQSRIQTREAIPGEQSGLEIGIGRRARRAYGFDEVALVPGGVTLNPDEVDITFSMGDRFTLPLPFWGSAMDGVVDVDFAIAMGKLGGVAVLNLDGVHTRYEDSAPVIKKIADADKGADQRTNQSDQGGGSSLRRFYRACTRRGARRDRPEGGR